MKFGGKTGALKFFRRMRFLVKFASELGGVGMFFKKVMGVFVKHGFKGIIVKSRYILHHANILAQTGAGNDNYHHWVNAYDKLTNEKIIKMEAAVSQFQTRPLISVIMPTFNTNPSWLKDAIESVQNQIYTNWELCIADDASTQKETLALLKHFETTDKRIKIVFRQENGHISVASNSAVSLASGDYLALLDHDDVLSKDALFWVVHTINKHPDAGLIYSDEDKLDENGNRVDPYFKSDWNYQLFLSQNMISHLGVYRADIVKAIGGFRRGFEGSQDYDLALRIVGQIKPEQIVHIPRLLYRWRMHKNSTAKDPNDKPFAVIAGQKAVAEHLQRKKIKAQVEILPINHLRVKYQLPENPPLVNIIIPSKNNKKLLQNCLQSVFKKTNYPNFTVLVVDNNSDDKQTIDFLRSLSNRKNISVLSYNEPFNFSAINNFAAKKVTGDFLCLLNDDTEIINDDWLTEMVSVGLQEDVGVVGAKLFYPDNTIQHGGVILGIGGVAGHSHKYFRDFEHGYFCRLSIMQELSAVTAACMLVKKSVYDEVGGFDEFNLTVAFNDVDFCLKVRSAGYKIVWTPFAGLYHYESASRGDDLKNEKLKRFQSEVFYMQKKWGEMLLNDPAYSPNLTLEKEDFSLAWPPRVAGLL